MTKKECIKLLQRAGYVTYKDKRGVTRWQQDGRYTLAHGEYDRPDYRIYKVRGTDDYYISGRYYYYANSHYAPADGPLTDGQLEAMTWAAERDNTI